MADIQKDAVERLHTASPVPTTMRMHMRRFRWLTNAYSKKAENHAYAVALHFMANNFCRIHKTLRCSPAMVSGVTDRLWEDHSPTN
jgi:hypothetical protein